jgi:hypothetical protein
MDKKHKPAINPCISLIQIRQLLEGLNTTDFPQKDSILQQVNSAIENKGCKHIPEVQAFLKLNGIIL